MTEDRRTEADAVADIVSRSNPQPFAVNEDGAPLIALPDMHGGLTVHDLSRYAARPHVASASVWLRDVGSLAGYVGRFRQPETAAFADWQSGRIEAVIDWHDPSEPRHALHRATFEAAHTEAWRAWKKVAGVAMSQTDFGYFLEEWAHVVVRPEPADLMEVVMNLEAAKKVSFKSAQRLADGMRQLHYVEEDQTKGGIRVPERLTLRLAVFEGMATSEIEVMLRFRIRDGILRFQVDIPRLAEIEREAFDLNVAALREAHPDLPVYAGRSGR